MTLGQTLRDLLQTVSQRGTDPAEVIKAIRVALGDDAGIDDVRRFTDRLRDHIAEDGYWN